ncbi:hypothetical protein RM545_15755 [Zunongwangia sp. F260]|uniref:Uncharacterized protein n=1 Tax=Autumnicola lenta TaxID=3075593 RepID=A0ABU3CP81_9FLAO|nr:hypothetical protein [Zunongwangia sp. F260]MDT0648150.1 hypothetical protein [Zunongwangia sp. F260]
MKTKKEKIKALEDIHQLHQNLSGLLEPTSRGTYKVAFEVKDNYNLLNNIISLLEVCAFALDGNGMLLMPSNQNATKEDSVCRVLELVISLLPDSQMHFIDRVTEKLSGSDNEI